jgi:DnaJ-class molecular chaperone
MDHDDREPIICPDCGGTGSHPWKNSFCRRCNGTGEIEDDTCDRRYKIARCREASGCFEF